MASKERMSALSHGQHFSELSYRQIAEGWTPEKIKEAFTSAEGGNLLQLADFVETMLTDDRIDGVLSTRTHGLLGLPRTLKGGLEVSRVLLEKHWATMHDEAELVRLMQWGIMLGIGLAQRIPLPRVIGQPQRYRLETWSPRWLFSNEASSDGGWQVITREGTRAVLPGSQFILFLPYGVKRPWAAGKWRSCAFPWALKHFALEDRANHSEVFGSPAKVGKAPQGATERQRKSFRSQLANLGRNGVLMLPEGWDYSVESATGNQFEIYSDSIAWADQALTIVLAGQIVTTEGTQGFSSGNVQDNIKGDFIRFDARRLEHLLYEQSILPWHRVNFGYDTEPPTPYWNTEKPVNQSQQAVTFEILGRAVRDLDIALRDSDVRVDTRVLAEKYQIPLVQVTKEAPKTTDKLISAPVAGMREPELP
jgi:phage gp29-like protein